MQIESVLRQADIFYGVPKPSLQKVATVCHECVYKKGDVIVKENTPSDELYIIVEGIVEIVIDPSLLGTLQPDVQPAVIANLWPGQTFGEVGLVDRGMRSASARAISEEARLQAIKREDLVRLCEEDHYFGYLLMRNIASDLAFKIRNTDLMLREQLLWESRPKGN
ncbi:MAG TPA: cyclic nucleotide-binding domain-containing protein [Anaerolineae bacterium]|nr:cyclic nucleotide-binding domain-containing protein [Anaerolineae bacterium]HQH38579.1 cyclic nucleotide-binding domain-containing protein [Anaerolineae bacterium]